MAGWTRHTGQIAVLPQANVDTDQLIPARFMSVPRSEGYGAYLMHDARRDASGALLPDHPLNRHAGASVLIARENFGSGSSREAAVYALVDAGFRAVIAPSFGDIFASNASGNGLLTATLDAQVCAQLEAAVAAGATQADVDLETSLIRIGAHEAQFAIDGSWRTKLINGWDDIDLTGQHMSGIERFRATRKTTAPWAWPAGAL